MGSPITRRLRRYMLSQQYISHLFSNKHRKNHICQVLFLFFLSYFGFIENYNGFFLFLLLMLGSSENIFEKNSIRKNVNKKNDTFESVVFFKAGDRVRTDNLNLGKVALCQLSYARNKKLLCFTSCQIILECQAQKLIFFENFLVRQRNLFYLSY